MNLEKRNLMAASCPVGLRLTHIMLLCESEKGAPSVGQMWPVLEQQSWIQPSSALQLATLCAQPHMAAYSPRELIHSAGLP